MNREDIIKAVDLEMLRAGAQFPPMRSAHEGIAVIEEEFMELREAVFWGRGDWKVEAVQLAAMACRLLQDVAK